ncbi:adenosylmethionine--8-amino-7-oxononanoate transaminase [Sorangium sp. So ce1335]|uniref:adenosylmethionine--8-amino-7-oxononanoate transaminase n=1 Tax=Sorangium sp. So ce1335 TaxID=3133335 RepID=UPI003F601673
MTRRDDLVARDRRCVIHPYAAPISSAPLFAVERAEGVRLTLTDGRELVDGMASWWAAIHGYGHPALTAAVRDQLGRMSHVMFGGLTHEPAVALCETLVAMTPEPLTRVFLADSGSVSVEVAIKLALQFFIAQGQPEKRRLVSVLGGYHGDTFGAMAVTDPVGGMHHLFRGALAQHLFAAAPGPAFDAPWSPDALGSMAALLEQHAREVAAVILEPIAQNAGGMRFYHPQYLRELRALCDRHGVLLILDEIATNFGRTGELFGCNHAAIAPDIMCLGKALTGGTMTLAATLCTERVAETIAGSEPRAFMHGPTYMGNPLACSAALASVRLLLDSPWRARVSAIEAQLRRELAPCRALDAVADVRVLGAIGVVELKRPVDMARVQPAFVERGVWLRPFGKLVYTMPPYVIAPEDLSRITGAIVSVVSEL